MRFSRRYNDTMSSLKSAIVSFLLLIFLAACAPQSNATPSIEQASPTVPSIEDGTASPTEAIPKNSPITLKLWLPPSFSNFSGDLPSALLQQRLDFFHEQNPNIQIDVRLKDEEGSGGLLESLAIASEAAPLALPDLVLMNESQLELAISNQLVLPLAERLGIDLGADWYSFGIEMVQAGDEIYALPFAGDAMILIHRFSAIEEAPRTWDDSLSAPLVVGFPAGDMQAFFTQLQYAGLLKSEGRAISYDTIDTELMLRVFDYYAEGQSTGIFPFWLTQFETEEQSWQAFLDGRMPMVVSSAKRYFLSTDDNQGGAAIPSIDGQILSFANAWAWAVTSPDIERQELAISLAEFLSDAEFMAQWSSAAGYLPARESTLAAWAPSNKQALGLQIATNALLIPRQEFRSSEGAIISQAVIALLKQEISPNEAKEILDAELSN